MLRFQVNRVKRLIQRREGQGMAEYGLILALVAVVAIIGIAVLGPRLQSLFQSIASHLVG